MWRLSATRSTRCLPPPAARLSGLSSTILAVLAPNINKRLEKSDRDESADAQRQHRVFYLSRCAVCIALGSTFAHVAWARDYFNPAFIENHGQASRTSVDLSTFDNDKASCRHTYYVTININKTEIGARNVDFQLTTLSDGQQALQGCLRLRN